MSMKRKISIILVLVLTMVFVSGCAKCIDTQYSTVNVKIVDEIYMGAYLMPVYCDDDGITLIPCPPVYEITVEYNNADYVISGVGSDTYDKYSDKFGECATGTLETKSYDDGTVRYRITELN